VEYRRRSQERRRQKHPKFSMEEPVVKSLSRLFLVALLTTLATGCVYVNGDKINTDDWKDTQVTNREAISQLDMGLSTQAVKDQLGAPADSEAFMDDGEEVRVLFYRTNHKHSDGETTRDETTPLVFRNDQLVGWGTRVYESLR